MGLWEDAGVPGVAAERAQPRAAGGPEPHPDGAPRCTAAPLELGVLGGGLAGAGRGARGGAGVVGALLRDGAVPRVEVDAPKLLEVTALESDANRMVVHLLNCTALSSGSNQMAPLANIGIRVNHGTLVRARLAIGDCELEVQENDLVIPAVGHSEVIVLEME